MKNAFALSEDEREVLSNPPLPPRLLRTIELALRRAWKMLIQNSAHKPLLNTASENQLTDWLIDALHELLQSGKIRGFNARVFQRPIMGAEFMDFSRTGFKKPDISIGLCASVRPGVLNYRFDYLYIECKLIAGGNANVAAYLDEGAHRFVHGQYAWAMREGMMLAYVRNSQKLPGTIETSLAATPIATAPLTRAEHLHTSEQMEACTLTSEIPAVYVSVHERHWSYLNQRGVPGPITLRHLWLDVA